LGIPQRRQQRRRLLLLLLLYLEPFYRLSALKALELWKEPALPASAMVLMAMEVPPWLVFERRRISRLREWTP
jgi:hypothetical protein